MGTSSRRVDIGRLGARGGGASGAVARPGPRTGRCVPMLLACLVLGACSRPTPSADRAAEAVPATARLPRGDAPAASLPAEARDVGAAEVLPTTTDQAAFASRPPAGESADLRSAVPSEPSPLPPDVATARASDRSSGEAPAATEAIDPAAPEVTSVAESALAPATEPAGRPTMPAGGPLAICQALRQPAAEALGLDAERLDLRAADVEDELWQTLLDGCQLAVTAAGAELAIGDRFDSLPAYRLRGVLRAAGWEADPAYSRLAPGESSDGYSRPGGLCIVQVRSRAPADRACAGQDPSCGLPPTALEHAIALRCARY